MARFEEILRLPKAAKYGKAFKERISVLLDAMVKSPGLRSWCYDKARDVIATCHGGILFALFEMEVKQFEEKMIALELSDEEVRQEIERIFNFHRLQELALLHSEQHSHEPAVTTEEAQVDALETVLFFYASPANTLDMPLGGERLHFMCYPELFQVTDDDVRKAVAQIQREKRELGQDFLINFISDKESWVNYLESRYVDIIAEHTHIFMDQMEQLEARKDKISEYDYLTQANAMAKEKNDSEQRLYRQLTKNILAD
ncbi:unnamed protein product [Rotaria sp. Silwood2]|nr:unnamed protein product [Rotaria sp. Silwood2]